jgi:23S rRNA C2498 (ribose-2'-O)-methylase RlmM
MRRPSAPSAWMFVKYPRMQYDRNAMSRSAQRLTSPVLCFIIRKESSVVNATKSTLE